MFFATVATFTADLSYARAVGKSEASTVLSLPWQKKFPPFAGGLLSARSIKSKISRKFIPTRHDSKSRRAVLDYSPGETSSSPEEEPSESSTNIFTSKTPFGGGEDFTSRTQEEPTTEESTADQSQREEENSRSRIFSEGEGYAATLPPLGSGGSVVPNGLALYSGSSSIPPDPFIPNPVPNSRLLDSGGYNMNPPLPGKIVTNPFEASLVPKVSTLVSTDNSGDSGVNAGKTKTMDQSSNTNKLSTEPEKSTGDRKDNNSEKAKADTVPDAALPKDTEKTPDGATEKDKPDGSPVIVNVYINSGPDDKGEKTYKITKVVEGESPDEEDSTAHGEENEAGATAETEPKLPVDQKPIKDDKEQKPIKDGKEEKTGDVGQSDGNEKPTSQTTTQQPPKKPDTDSEKQKTEEKADTNDTENKNPGNPNSEIPDSDKEKPDTTDSKTKDEKTNDTKTNDTNKEKTDKQETAKPDPPPEKMKHGDYTAFLPDGAKDGESFSTQSAETSDQRFGKVTLSNKAADLIAWKGNPDEDTKDVSSAHPARSKQRRRTRSFRA